jgi:hypothetical protein
MACGCIARTVIFHDVRLSGRDHEADLVGSTIDHALDQILAHGAGALDSIVEAAADGQQFLREG